MFLGVASSVVGRLMTSAASQFYAIAGKTPQLVLDFLREAYRVDGAAKPFDSALTATRAGNATMVDSDGKIKWAPHNFFANSEDLTTLRNGSTNVSLTGNTVFGLPSYTVTGTVDDYPTLYSAFGTKGTTSVYVRAAPTNPAISFRIAENAGDSGATLTFSNGVVSNITAGVTYTISPLSDGWYRFEVSKVRTQFRYMSMTFTGGDVEIVGYSSYRSDLGGMVNNPDRGDSYVPTTSAARYLPRRGHHVYNGSEWVNEGLLVESEARTNLFLNSGSLSTQSVTVTAVPHTLSFTGTGTITLTGVSTAGPLVGTGTGENNRVSLTFTPTAGVLLATVTGTVTNAQLEAGSTPSSYIPTAGATVTRAAETLVIPSANLPWPAPVVIGPELVTNGTFDTDTTGWTAASGGSLSVVGGVLRVTEALVEGATGRAFQVIPTVVGKLYLLSVDLIATSHAFDVAVNINSNFGGAIVTNRGSNTPRTIRLPFVATATSTYIIFGVGVDTLGSYSDYDNISVKEINPLAVSIAMDGRATGNTLTTARWYNSSTAYITQSIGTTNFSFAQYGSGALDTVTGGSITPGINIPFNIASRHGSTFINGAVDGVALTADLTPTSLPDLSASNLQLGYAFMGTIGSFRIWADDIGDAGLVTATNPSTEPSLLLTFDSAETSFVDLGWSE